MDVLVWSRRTSRVHAQLKDICAILSGLMVAQDYRRGQQLLVDRNFRDNAAFFQVCLCLCLSQRGSGVSASIQHLTTWPCVRAFVCVYL